MARASGYCGTVVVARFPPSFQDLRWQAKYDIILSCQPIYHNDSMLSIQR